MSLANWLSLIIELLTLTQLWLLSRKKRIGWAVALSCQVWWLWFCLLTHNWPFLVGVAVFGYVDWQGWRKWRTP
ncbi:MAG: hypothetical protein ACXVGB_00015 [Mycobacteriaceae bacterium]